MSTFKRILTEKNRKDYGKKGGDGGIKGTRITPFDRRENRANMQDPSRSGKTQFNRPTRVTSNPSGMTITNMAGGNVTDEQKFAQLEKLAKEKSSKSVAAADDVSPQMRTQAADTSARAKKTGPAQRRPLADTTKGGPVKTYKLGQSGLPSKEAAKTLQRMTTADPTTTARLQANLRRDGISQAKSSKQQAAYRRARQQLKSSGTKFFGTPTGVDAQGKPTYVPPKETPKGETGRRAQRQASPRSYASVKAEIEGAKGFSGSRSGGLETRTVPKPVTDYRQKRAGRRGLVDPFDATTSFSQKSFERDLKRISKGQSLTTANPLSQAEFKAKLVRGKNRPPLFPKPDFPATVPNTKPKPPAAPDRTATKQAVKDLRASQQRLNVKPAPTTGDLVTKSKPATQPVKTNTLAVRQSGISKQGRGPVAGPYDVIDVDVKVDPPKKPPLLNPSQQKKVTQRILKTAKPQLGRRLASKSVPNLATKVNAQAATKNTLRGAIGRGLAGAAGAAFDVVQGREDAKKAGASDRRAWLRGAARAAGGLVGGTLGAIGGGGIGSAALGIGGYMAGSQIGDKLFTSLAGGTQKQKDWLRQKNLATQAGTRAKDVQYRKGNQAVVFDKRVGKERIGTWDPKSQTYKADVTNPVKAYTAKNPFERLGRQFARSNEGSGLFGMGLVKGYGLADMAKRYYANKDEAARRKRVSDFKSTATR